MREWLVELRNKSGYTQEGIAKKAGISRSYYAEIERGRIPSGKAAYRISKVLGFNMEKFFEENK